MGKELILPEELYQQMQEDVESNVPDEACGLIAGRKNKAVCAYRITNVVHSPTRFRMDPEEQLEAFNNIDDLNLELLAIYHSHPHGPKDPSVSDYQEFAYPGIVYLIWSRIDGDWICCGYDLDRQDEVTIQIHPN
jgi:proteasome lid subunit RPN8/RPN11